MDYFKADIEKNKRRELEQLMQDWKNEISTKGQIIFPDDNKSYDAIEYFNSDGFFPGYYSAEKKVLFIGRESRYNSTYYTNGDRITTELERFNKNMNPNTSSYWRRILYITYGIKNKGCLQYADLPSAKEILSEMIKANNYGFAIMNISKYSNDSVDGATADFKLINRFLKDSILDKRNFIKEEIELLSPDIIITANLWDGNIDNYELEKVFPNSQFELQDAKKGIASFWNFTLGDRNIQFIDTWHFSKMGSDEKLFYNPVMEFLFK